MLSQGPDTDATQDSFYSLNAACDSSSPAVSISTTAMARYVQQHGHSGQAVTV